jgi:hypothetical protein
VIGATTQIGIQIADDRSGQRKVVMEATAERPYKKAKMADMGDMVD